MGSNSAVSRLLYPIAIAVDKYWHVLPSASCRRIVLDAVSSAAVRSKSLLSHIVSNFAHFCVDLCISQMLLPVNVEAISNTQPTIFRVLSEVQ